MTGLSLDDVVALNALIVTAIGLSLAFGRRDRKVGPLDLSSPKRKTAMDQYRDNHASERGIAPSAQSLEQSLEPKRPMFGARDRHARSPTHVPPRSAAYGAEALKRLERQDFAESRELNVFFNWNGHTWDAYEVLGIPAGSSRESIVQAFHAARARNPDSIAFLQAAADAILKGRF